MENWENHSKGLEKTKEKPEKILPWNQKGLYARGSFFEAGVR